MKITAISDSPSDLCAPAAAKIIIIIIIIISRPPGPVRFFFFFTHTKIHSERSSVKCRREKRRFNTHIFAMSTTRYAEITSVNTNALRHIFYLYKNIYGVSEKRKEKSSFDLFTDSSGETRFASKLFEFLYTVYNVFPFFCFISDHHTLKCLFFFLIYHFRF